MSFFQNPFTQDFLAPWLLSDRKYNPDFKCPRNAGRGDEMVVAFGQAPFNLSGNDSDAHSKAVLTISFALNDTKNWADLAITISGSSLSAITNLEVVSSLNANAVFSNYFTAKVRTDGKVQITQSKPVTSMRFYIKNGRAESVLLFNKLAGVAEMPTYFARHTIANRFNYSDSQNALILLDASGSNVDGAVIDNAVDNKGISLGLSHSTVQEDWRLIHGRSGLFMFQKNTVDTHNRITQTIEYPAGAIAGDLALKINYVFTGVTNTVPDQVTQIPYTLTAGDLVTPP
jgi:hypothetical protein